MTFNRIWSLFLFGIALCMLPASALGISNDTVVVGSKNFTEQLILGEIIAQTLEAKTGLHVVRKFNLGGVLFTFQALQSRQIDLYPEYTGTGLITILKEPVAGDASKTYRRVQKAFHQKYQMTWGPVLGFENTYSLAVRGSDPLMKSVRTITDFVALNKPLKLGMPHEFLARPDGFKLLQQHYGFTQIQPVPLESGLMYTALKAKQVDAIVAFSTDGRIDAFKFKVLNDNAHVFPPYEAAFLMRDELLKSHPEVKQVTLLLANKISAVEMRKMNDAVDARGEPPETVASRFLEEAGIRNKADRKSSEKIASKLSQSEKGFPAYAWSNRLYLLGLIQQHITICLIATGIACVIAIPLGILLTRLPRLPGLVFSVLNVIQTIPSLALLGFMIPLTGIGILPAIIALFLYALLPLVRNTYTGIQGIDPTLKESCVGIGMTPWQVLWYLELPLALPIMMAGIRTATVIVIGTATLAAFVGAGGLGDPILQGISSVNTNRILLGAIPAALLAVCADRLLAWIEFTMLKRYQPMQSF